jgi:hypothetical protein
MVDFLLLVFFIVLMISLYGLLVSYRSRSRDDKQVYYTAENTAADGSGDESA